VGIAIICTLLDDIVDEVDMGKVDMGKKCVDMAWTAEKNIVSKGTAGNGDANIYNCI